MLEAAAVFVRRLSRAPARLLLAVVLLVLADAAPAATTVTSVRIWPASEYTRLTLESAAPVQFNYFTIKNPERLVLDLEGVELNATLREMASKLTEGDPYIKQMRIGRFKPNVLRLVLDLKGEVKPQVFTLKPVGEYGHRLVLDIYPAQPADPLLALVEPPKAVPLPPAEALPPAPVGESETKLPEAKLPEIRPSEAKPPEVRTADARLPEPKAAKAGEAKVPDAKPEAAPAPSKGAAEESRVPVKDVSEPAKAAADKPARKKAALNLGRTVTVVIDAGHGGEDPGARGARGTHEKEVTLAIARRVKARIDEETGMRGVLTRDGDYFIPLHGRVIKARNAQADLFVSIHADAFIRPDARGSSVFALSERGATSAAARWLAKRENEADLIGGVRLDVKDPYLAQTLLDLSQTATINDSLKLAKAVLGELGGINRLHKGSVEQAGFAVLKAPDIPSILVETAFISNPEEESRLNDEAYQDKMARAIVSGIRAYFAKNPPLAKSKLARSE